MEDKPIEKQYEKAFEQAASLHPMFPASAKKQMAQMVEAIAKGNNNIDMILSTKQSAPIKGGFIAEEYHAETFNLDAILNGDDSRAYTDNYDEWYKQKWNGKNLVRNDNTDVVITKDGEVNKSYQAKYMKDAHDTAGAMSQMGADGKPKYNKNDAYVGPSDQIEDVKRQSLENIDKNMERNGDPARRQAYQETHDKVTDTVSNGKSSSKPLSKKEANELGSGNKEHLEQVENQYKTDSTFQQMGNAAVGAASMSAIVSGSLNTVKYIQQVQNGEISGDEAVVKIVGETVASAADSAVKASANAGVQSLMVRYGSKEAAMQVLAKQGVQSMLKTNAVTMGVSCAVDMVKDLVRLGTGAINKEEFFDRQGKGVLTTSAGAAGGALGMAGAESMAALLGVQTGTLAMGAASIVGGLAGGMIAGLAMTLAIENGIEKPYRDLVRNTTYLHEAARELDRVSQTMMKGQAVFVKYLEADIELEKNLQNQFDRVNMAGIRALDAINRI